MPEKPKTPWTGFDVLLFFSLWLTAMMFCAVVPQEQTHTVIDQHKHPVEQLLEQGRNAPAVLLVVFLAVAVAAPLIEELLFRLFLQGWFESKLVQHQIPHASLIAVAVVSFCFAIIHAGSGVPLDPQSLFYQFTAVSAVSLTIFVLGICYLTGIRKMSLLQCLFGMEPFFRPQLARNAGFCMLAVVCVLFLAGILNHLAPGTNTDPIPIFFFSLVLGIIYSRTRNLVYCVILHACLNLTSLVFVLSG